MGKLWRVGLAASGFGSGTGPATYFASARRVVAERFLAGLVCGAGCGDADLVHVIDAKRLDLGLLDALKVPVALDYHDDYWVHTPRYPAPDAALRRLRAWQLRRRHLAAMARAGHVIVHSEAVAKSVNEVLAGPEFKGERRPAVHMVPYGIETAQALSPVVVTREPIILLVGRDLFRKGFGVLAQALPRVMAARPDARVAVIGDEYPHTRLAAKIIARGLPIEFLPRVGREELAAWYGRASVLVLPSWQEAFGIVLIEAMAAGLPVAASRTGGIPEAVEHGVSGLLSAPGDADALADNIIAVLDDAALRERLIAGGRGQAGKFSPARMGERLGEVYDKMMEAK